MSHSKIPAVQCVPSAPIPLSIYTLQGLTFRNHERHIRVLGTVTALRGRTRPGRGGTTGEKLERGTLREGEPPLPPFWTLTRVSGITPLHTYFQPGCRSVFFTREKKISCERPGRRLSHETLQEPLVLDPRELSGTVVKIHARIRNTEGSQVRTGPPALLQVCPHQGPPFDLQVPEPGPQLELGR